MILNFTSLSVLITSVEEVIFTSKEPPVVDCNKFGSITPKESTTKALPKKELVKKNPTITKQFEYFCIIRNLQLIEYMYLFLKLLKTNNNVFTKLLLLLLIKLSTAKKTIIIFNSYNNNNI